MQYKLIIPEFRIWHSYQERMYGKNSKSLMGNNINLCFFNGKKQIDWGVYDSLLGNKLCDSQDSSNVLMPYTNRKDKNGNKLFLFDFCDVVYNQTTYSDLVICQEYDSNFCFGKITNNKKEYDTLFSFIELDHNDDLQFFSVTKSKNSIQLTKNYLKANFKD